MRFPDHFSRSHIKTKKTVASSRDDAPAIGRKPHLEHPILMTGKYFALGLLLHIPNACCFVIAPGNEISPRRIEGNRSDIPLMSSQGAETDAALDVPMNNRFVAACRGCGPAVRTDR